MTREVEFVVQGTPKPQGSKRHVGNGIMVESGGQPLRTWREDVKHAASRALVHGGSFDSGPISVDCFFRVARPKSHYRTGKNAHLLRDGAPAYPATRPDLDKLLRSTFDAITTAGLWLDDAQVVLLLASMTYATTSQTPGARVRVHALSNDPGATE